MNTDLIYNPSDTICAIATAAGTGAIAVVRISGPEAFAVADRIWQGHRLSDATSHTAHLGYIIDPITGDILDQAVATVFRGPRSFTGDDTVELAIHGSRWIQRHVLDLIIRRGARLALPGEFTRRAYASGRMDLAEAEAVGDLIAASSKAAHRHAMDQMRGHFSAELNGLRDRLINLSSLLELELDFSEEEVEFADRSTLRSLAADLEQRLRRLAGSFSAGQAIKEGIPVAIIGPTNAGKSSLLNALVGDDRAIVSDIHGTTRDIVEDTAEIGPYLIRFLDTAGLRDTTDAIEAIGIGRSLNAAGTARIVLYLIDSYEPQSPEEIADALRGIDPDKIIYVANKSDLVTTTPAGADIAISAKTKQGLKTLKDAVLHKIDSMCREAGDTIVTNARHAAALTAAAESAAATVAAIDAGLPSDLIAQDLRQTIHHLSTITGQISAPDVLNNIFAHFCIGK